MSITSKRAAEVLGMAVTFNGCGRSTSDEMREAVSAGIAALLEKAEREDPKPLTIDELGQMNGEPVWTVGVSSNGGTWAGWDIIESVDDDGCFFGYSTEKKEWWAYNLRDLSGSICGCAWVAYRHKPKEV